MTNYRDMVNQTELLQPNITIEHLPHGSDMPYRIIVGNNPVNFVDPWGLAKWHFDRTPAGDRLIHVGNYRYNVNGELVDHMGRPIENMSKEARNTLNWLRRKKPDFFRGGIRGIRGGRNIIRGVGAIGAASAVLNLNESLKKEQERSQECEESSSWQYLEDIFGIPVIEVDPNQPYDPINNPGGYL